MKFDKYLPIDILKPYVKYLVISENELENEYTVYPVSGLVIGLQYRGQLSILKDGQEQILNTAGITGITDSFKNFKSGSGIGTILVYFTETGFAHFTSNPVHELFNLSLSLEDIFEKSIINEVADKLSNAQTDKQRIHIVEQFLLSQLQNVEKDRLIVEAVQLIYQSKGAMRIKELNEKLYISPSAFEKRFRKVVGTTPKKFSSIVRFNTVLDGLNNSKSLTAICYENDFFDQAHFIKDFRLFTGDTPEHVKRLL